MVLKTYEDQIYQKITVNYPPKRIISLVPSQTELLYDLGLDAEIVGVTKFCIYPEEKVMNCQKIGGTKKVDFEKIRQLHPDLIIGNKEENQKEDIQQLMQHYPVWMSDIYNLNDALDMIKHVGALVDKRSEADNLANHILMSFSVLQEKKPAIPKKVAYFIWKKPYMLVAKQTFIDDMLSLCGFENVLNSSRYPALELDDMKDLNPETVFLSSEPYPFTEKHRDEFQEIFPHAKIDVVDGEMFSWYGSHLKYAVSYFEQLKSKIF